MKLLKSAGKKKSCKLMVLIKTKNKIDNQESLNIYKEIEVTENENKIIVIDSYITQIQNLINNI